MKKILVCLTVCIFLLTMPSVLFAKKKSMSDGELHSTTAQEGVSIEYSSAGNLPEFTALGGSVRGIAVRGQIAPTINSWGDDDGCTSCSAGYTDKGWVGYRELSMSPTSAVLLTRTMDIDIGTNASGASKVIVGLPSVWVHPVGTSAVLGFSDDVNDKELTDGSGAALSNTLGHFYNSQFALMVNPDPHFLALGLGLPAGLSDGCLVIGNHATTNSQGVEIEFTSKTANYGPYRGVYFWIPPTLIEASWGDTNGDQSGATTYTDAGYFGLYQSSLGQLVHVRGTMNIDVGTNDSGTTAVIIGLPTTTIASSVINATLALGTVNNFSDNQVRLGRAYSSGFSVSPSGSIAVYAH